LTAALTFNRPYPKTAFGTAAPGKLPQSCVAVSGSAVFLKRSSDAVTCPIICGAADQSRAKAPATSGAEPEVPENPDW
jgi:hypothetical protein